MIKNMFMRIWSRLCTVFPWLGRFLKFGIVGLSNTFIYWVTYYGLLFLHAHYQIATVTAFAVSVTNAYLWNKFWVFKDRPVNKKTPLKFFVVYGGNLLFNVAFAYLWVDVLHWSEYLVPVFSLCITVPVNFLLNKNWAFSGKDNPKED